MESESHLPHLKTLKQIKSVHNTSEDSGTCHHPNPASPDTTSVSPINHEPPIQTASKPHKPDDSDTLYSDSFESSNNSQPPNESEPQNIISDDETQPETITINEMNKITDKPPAPKRTTSTKQKHLGCEIILRSESLKKIYSRQSSSDNVLFKNAPRFSRSKSNNQINYNLPILQTSSKNIENLKQQVTSTPTNEIEEGLSMVENEDQKLKHSTSTPLPKDCPLKEAQKKESSQNLPHGRIKTGLTRKGTAKTVRCQPISRATTDESTITDESNSNNLLKSILLRSKTAIKPQSINSLDQNRKSTSNIPTKTSITVDISKARSNTQVVTQCVEELEWQCCPQGLANQSCDVIWLSTNQDTIEPTTPNPYHSKVNKFPSMNSILKKGPLTRALNVMRQIYKDEYKFYPRTWFLPEEMKEFCSECRYIHDKQVRSGQTPTTFILKPNDGSQGEGIYLIRDPEDYLKLIPKKNRNRPYIVQEYIHNPFLIDNLKSDLRVYVVVASVKPLEIYLCDEGLVRFATVDYESPDESNYRSSYMHLTNYSINKKNEDYKFYDREMGAVKVNKDKSDKNTSKKTPEEDAGEGSKRKLSTVLAYMHAKGYNVAKIRAQIDDLVVKTVIALMPEMLVNCAFDLARSQQKLAYFQIIGFDILLTDKLKPVLLEVNCNPSLRVDYEIEAEDGTKCYIPSLIDEEIKKPLVMETLRLIAPKKKLDIIEQCRRKEEQIEKANKYRNSLVQQRMIERLNQQLIKKKFDYSKCPLLSKPGEQYIKKLNNKTSPRSLSLFNEFHNLRSTSSSIFYTSFTSMSKINITLNSSTNSDNNNNSNCSVISNRSAEKSCLREIYPYHKSTAERSDNLEKNQYNKFFILESIADIFIYFTLGSNVKLMNHTDFRAFVRKCNLVNENTSSDNLDIIFFDLSKKWQMYNRRYKSNDTTAGLCFQAFIQFFLTFSQLNYDEKDHELNLTFMIKSCQTNMRPPPAVEKDLKMSSVVTITQDNELVSESGNGFNIKDLKIRPKTIGSCIGSAATSSSAKVTRPLFTTTEKYTSPPSLNLNSSASYNRSFVDFKASVACKSLKPGNEKTKKSLFPIFFDSSSRA